MGRAAGSASSTTNMLRELILLAIAQAAAAAPVPKEDSWTQVTEHFNHSLPLTGSWKVQKAFSDDDVKTCTRIRTPYLETSGDDHYHLFAICCGDNACGHKTRRSGRRLLDNHEDARVIMTTSKDKGATWEKSKFLTGKGYANAKAVFDSSRNTLVVQYSKNGKGVYQVTSKDHGASWSKQTKVEVANKCGGGGNGGGGQRAITKTGRMIFYSDTPGCIWYSDDGGKTYKTAPHDPMRNEVSFVSLSDGSLYGNGRSTNPSWAPHRIDYRSDNGIHWTV